MGKKVTVISTSLRHGSNSAVLADAFAMGASEAGNEVTLISLTGKDIHFCTGCLACQKTGKCVIHDDMNDMQEIVGGHIEAIYPFKEQVAIIANEEGKILGLPFNRPLSDERGVPYDIVCGTFFMAGLGSEDFTSLTDDQIRRYKKMFDNRMVFTVPAKAQAEKNHPKKGKSHER